MCDYKNIHKTSSVVITVPIITQEQHHYYYYYIVLFTVRLSLDTVICLPTPNPPKKCSELPKQDIYDSIPFMKTK